MEQRFPNSKQFYTFNITEESMKEQFDKAQAQQEEERKYDPKLKDKPLDILELLRTDEKARRGFLLPLATPKLPEQYYKYHTDTKTVGDYASFCKIIGRSNQDRQSQNKINVDLIGLTHAQIGQALLDSVFELSERIKKDDAITDGTEGSTLTACFVACEESGRQIMWLAQLGDSCAYHVLGSNEKKDKNVDKITRLVVRQKPKDEKERIEKEGGTTFTTSRGNVFVTHQVKVEDYIHSTSYSLPRALGYKNPEVKGISDVAEISKYITTKNLEMDSFLIIISDGPLDLNDDAAIRDIRHFPIEHAGSELFKYAFKICALSYRQAELVGSTDSIDDAMAVIVDLNKLPLGNYAFVVCDGNSSLSEKEKRDEDAKHKRQHIVAQKACAEFPQILETKINSLQILNNQNQISQLAEYFHEPAESQESLSLKASSSQQISSTQIHNSNNSFQLFYHQSDSEADDQSQLSSNEIKVSKTDFKDSTSSNVNNPMVSSNITKLDGSNEQESEQCAQQLFSSGEWQQIKNRQLILEKPQQQKKRKLRGDQRQGTSLDLVRDPAGKGYDNLITQLENNSNNEEASYSLHSSDDAQRDSIIRFFSKKQRITKAEDTPENSLHDERGDKENNSSASNTLSSPGSQNSQ